MAEEPEVDTQTTFNTEVVVAESTALSTGIHGLIPLTKTKKGWNDVLKNEHASRLLTQTMTTFINVDMRFDVGMKSMGEMLVNLLKQGPEIHRKFIEAVCLIQGIPTIEYSEKAPLKSCALALFAKFPDMAENVKGGKDTKGSLRLSSYIFAYKEGLKKIAAGGGRTPANHSGQPRSAGSLFETVWDVLSPAECKVFEKWLKRAKVDYSKWVPAEESEEAAEKE